ncbi:ABC transporter ATP-binding protein/permease [Candidatus Pelagibacter sp.]|jgi:ABC-type multidrug transport system fused ATPase/permease subunit|nr:ABC transporter ATP-binding protein/permease [Candidatus Pelagibacter sp.]
MNSKISNIFFSFFKTLKNLIYFLDKQDSKKSLLMLFFILIGTLLEMVSLGLIFPVIQLTLNNNIISEYPFLLQVKELFHLTDNSLIILMLISIIIIFLIKNIFLIITIIYKGKFVQDLQKKITAKLYNKYLNQNYSFFIKNNTSELIRNLTQECPKIVHGIDGMLIIFTEFFILIGICIILIYLSPFVSGVVIGLNIILMLIWILNTKKKFSKLGEENQTLYSDVLKETQQGFGNFKEIIIYKLRDNFSFQFKEILVKFCKNIRVLGVLTQIPRILLEQLAVILIIVMAITIFLFEEDKIKSAAIIGVYAYALFKILPSISKLILNLQKLIFVKPSIETVKNQLSVKVIEQKNAHLENKIKFKEEISIEKMSFKNENKIILRNIDLKIKKNSKVGLIGKTGSGKSTLLNIIMGLIQPSYGKIKVDGKTLDIENTNWQKKISFVSQSTYLLDESILKNITFNDDLKNIDLDKLDKALKSSRLEEFIETLDLKLNTIVGERGSKISGGELQRIGIARAIYNDTEILILDEFTSSLDEKTESEIIENIFSLDKTIIVATHRILTLKYCDTIYELNNSQLFKTK